MTLEEIKNLSTEEIARRMAELERSFFDLRVRHAAGQLKQTADLQKAKRERARMLTILRDRKQQEGSRA